jgi:hypothetical protein
MKAHLFPLRLYKKAPVGSVFEIDATDKDSFVFSQAVESSHMISDFNGRESFLLWDKCRSSLKGIFDGR